MYFTTKPGMLKAVILVIGLIVAAVGCDAVFNSAVYKTATTRDWFTAACKIIDGCPSEWLTWERFFVGTSITFLILSAVNLALGFVINLSASGIKAMDAAYHVIAGILLLTGAALLLASATQLDDPKYLPRELKGQKYHQKVAAGALGILNSVLYFATAGIIFIT